MSAQTIAIIYGLFFLGLCLYFLIFSIQYGPTILKLYRERIDPPYPLTSRELFEKVKEKSNPLEQFKLNYNTLLNQQKNLWSKHSGDKEIDALTEKMRKTFISIIILIIIGGIITFTYLAKYQ